ncbi:MAG: hypothetical protein WB421_17345 [Terriglobales bacterium]
MNRPKYVIQPGQTTSSSGTSLPTGATEGEVLTWHSNNAVWLQPTLTGAVAPSGPTSNLTQCGYILCSQPASSAQITGNANVAMFSFETPVTTIACVIYVSYQGAVVFQNGTGGLNIEDFKGTYRISVPAGGSISYTELGVQLFSNTHEWVATYQPATNTHVITSYFVPANFNWAVGTSDNWGFNCKLKVRYEYLSSGSVPAPVVASDFMTYTLYGQL